MQCHTAPFEAVKLAAIALVATVDSDDSLNTKKENVRYAISTIDDDTPYAVRYVEPAKEEFKAGCEETFHDTVATAAEEAPSH